MLRKILFNFHWLIGITVGMVLALMGLTGAIMSFQDEILSVLNGRPGHVVPTGRALSTDEIVARVQAVNPGKQISALIIADSPEQAVKVEFVRPGGVRPRLGEDDGSRYFNQYTGEMMAATLERGRQFMAWNEYLHRSLVPWSSAVAGNDTPSLDVGKHVTAYATLLLLTMTLTGLYLRWPRRKVGDWRSWLKVNFKLKGYAFNYNLHAVIGTVALLGYLLSAHSGLMMSEIHWYGDTLNRLAGMEIRRGPPPANTAGNHTQHRLDMLWDAFKREVPAFHTATIQLARSNADELQIRYLLNKAVTREGGRNTNTLVLDAETGAVKSHDLFSDKPAAQRVLVRNFDLHSGAYFGMPGRLFITFTSLMMPVLLVTGWMQYLARRRHRRQRAEALKAAQAG